MSNLQWLEWAQRLQAISQTGLAFVKDSFDKERSEAIQQIAAEIMAKGAGMADVAVIRDLFGAQVGYPTPKVDVRAAVFDEGRLLLVREREDGRWSLPGGWADIGSSAAENVIREVKEESGYDAEIIKLAAVFDRDRHGHPPIPFYTYILFFLCRLKGGHATQSQETDSASFFGQDEIPPLSLTRNVPAEIQFMFEHYRHPDWPTTFD